MKKKDGEENNNAELQKIIEESERKLREEKEKIIKIKIQVDETEKKLVEEELKRLDVEKKFAPLKSETDEERKKREEAERMRDASDKNLKKRKKKS